MLHALTVLAILAAPMAALAQDVSPLTNRDVKGHFENPPKRAYPEAALHRALNGKASALCIISPSGTLEGCQVASETPTGMGFGDATMLMTKAVRVDPKANDGSDTVGRKYLFEMNFALPH